jgi:hypothetical protein
LILGAQSDETGIFGSREDDVEQEIWELVGEVEVEQRRRGWPRVGCGQGGE